MKRKLLILLTFMIISTNFFADSFTDAIQDLAVVIACKGTYARAEAGYDDDPDDFYTPNMMASRFASESGNKTMTTTFYGVCFDYAQFAYQDIEKYQSWYNKQGMYENKFWIAGTHENNNEIILQYPGTKSNHTAVQNGVYVIIPPGRKYNVKTHDGITHHAWVWIERADGVQFWIDPTWTDTSGYVVYGYVENGQEVQCRPSREFCINYPAYLDNLPLPPSMGQRKAPSKSANSTNRNEILQDSGTEWADVVAEAIVDTLITKPFIDVDYSRMKHEYEALVVSADIPVSSITEKSFSLNKMGFSLELPWLLTNGAGLIGLEYMHNLEDGNKLYAGLLEIDFLRRIINNIAWFLGGGVGLRFDTANEYGAPGKISGLPDTGYFAFKVDTGFIINISHLFTKVEVSYNNVFGFSVGAGVGFGLEL